MERRFICPACQTKWFTLDGRDATEPCARGGTPLERYVEPSRDDEAERQPRQ
jgi:hypothetical protein